MYYVLHTHDSVYIAMPVCKCSCMHTSIHSCTCACMYICIGMYNVCMHVCMCYASMYICMYRSRCHGNVRLNDDSKSERSIPIALRVIINPVDVRGGQSARDNKSHTRTLRAECA